MKHTLRLLSILTASGALLAGSIGCEQGLEPEDGDGDGGVAVSADRGRGPSPGRMAEALGLDERQREQASALRAAMEADLQPIEQQLREKEEQLRALWAAETPDRAAILEQGAQVDQLRRAMRDRQTEFRIAVNGLLTDEQRARMAERGRGRGDREPRGDRGLSGPRGEGGEDGERLGPPPAAPGQGLEHGAGPRRGHGRGPGGPGGEMMAFGPGMAQRLGLDEAQQAQVQTLADQLREASAPTREQMASLREQERALWSAGQVDARALGELNDRMDALMSAERERQVDFRLALLQVLTPEQRARLAELPLAHGPRGIGPRRGMGPHHRAGIERDLRAPVEGQAAAD